MRRKNDKSSLGLKFKAPSPKDRKLPLGYHPLTPGQYLDFIETGIKLLPNPKIAMKRSMRHVPKVRFVI